MRGKDPHTCFQMLVLGITPAYAGKSADRQVVIVRQWDHPRLCGEKVLLERPLDTVGGSPPPMRGKADFCGII